MNFESCIQKQEELIQFFSKLPSREAKYHSLIELGCKLPSFPKNLIKETYLVKGCQSALYLYSELKAGKFHCQAFSKALISAGLAAILVSIYNHQPPEAVIQCSPYFLKKIGIFDLVSLSRVNGLKSFYLRLRQDAIRLINGAPKNHAKCINDKHTE